MPLVEHSLHRRRLVIRLMLSNVLQLRVDSGMCHAQALLLLLQTEPATSPLYATLVRVKVPGTEQYSLKFVHSVSDDIFTGRLQVHTPTW